jgi:hypothetical protein
VLQYPHVPLRLSAHKGTAWFQALFGEAFYHLWYLKALIVWRLVGPVLDEGERGPTAAVAQLAFVWLEAVVL